MRAVRYALEREGYEVDAVYRRHRCAGTCAQPDDHDLAILDVMMPGASGLAVCREIRAESALPIILLTARDAEVDTVSDSRPAPTTTSRSRSPSPSS